MSESNFIDCIQPHLSMLLRHAEGLAKNHADAEDLVQETLMKAMKAFDHLENQNNMRAWLMTIMRRAHIDAYRKKQTRIALAEVDQIDDFTDPSQDDQEQAMDLMISSTYENPGEIIQKIGDEELLHALKQLQVNQRWTVLLADVEGFSMEQIADIMNTNPSTAKTRLHRARHSLASLLLDEDQQSEGAQ